MRGIACLVNAAVLTAGLLLSFPAVAADPAPGRAHFDRGQALLKELRYVDAIAEFQAAYDIDKKALLLFNIAECARLAGDSARARGNYEHYLRDDAAGKFAELARQRLAEIGPKAPPPVQVAPVQNTAAAIVAPSAPPPAPPPVVAPHAARRPAPAKLVPAPLPPRIPPPAAAGLVVHPAAPAPLVEESPPLWKRWPVWTAVGVAVVGGTVAAIALSRGSSGCTKGCVDLR